MPSTSYAGEGQRRRGVGPVHGQLGEDDGAAELRRRLGPLVQPQAPLVADLDPVVQEADDAERHHGQHGQVPGAGEADLGADVPHGVPEHHAADDGQPPHGGRARLDAVAGRAVLA